MMINTVCLCGSTRFAREFEEANVELTKRGYSVITISMCLPKGDQEDAGLKTLLDLVHLNKILRSDAVVIVGDGYVGESTAREILWANMHDKVILPVAAFEHWDEVEKHFQVRSIAQLMILERARERLGLGR